MSELFDIEVNAQKESWKKTCGALYGAYEKQVKTIWRGFKSKILDRHNEGTVATQAHEWVPLNSQWLALRINHLHASKNILIAFLIAVTSRLDAVVTCTNVL